MYGIRELDFPNRNTYSEKCTPCRRLDSKMYYGLANPLPLPYTDYCGVSAATESFYNAGRVLLKNFGKDSADGR